jgi:hypothetical protein
MSGTRANTPKSVGLRQACKIRTCTQADLRISHDNLMHAALYGEIADFPAYLCVFYKPGLRIDSYYQYQSDTTVQGTRMRVPSLTKKKQAKMVDACYKCQYL